MNSEDHMSNNLSNYFTEYSVQFRIPGTSSRNPEEPTTPPPRRSRGIGSSSQHRSYAAAVSTNVHVGVNNHAPRGLGPPFPETHHRHDTQRQRGLLNINTGSKNQFEKLNFKSVLPVEPPPPIMIPKEVVIITAELQKKLRNASPFTAPFFHKTSEETPHSSHHSQHLTQTQVVETPTLKPWKWNHPSYVRIPLSMDYTHDNSPKWNLIEESLSKLKSACQLGFDPGSNDDSKHWFRKTISSYNIKAKNSSNFGVIQNDFHVWLALMRQLPGIIDHALKLPCRLENPIPILRRGEYRTIYLTRNLACSLLANAFLCTFPEQDGRKIPYFDFYSLYDQVDSTAKTQVKREKLKCMLNYFAELSRENPNYPNTIISYERRCVSNKFNWAASTDPLSKIQISSQQKLENNVGMLQVDFANKWVGGGVLNEGAVQEEIRFVISPELIVARLFTEPLDDDEVLVVTGTAQYSSYTGYSDTFKWADLSTRRPAELDNLGREHTQVVAMDALSFKPYESDKQYSEDKLKRELHKCYVGFIPGKHPTPVATGLWGCGCFNGDPQLKFLIQWMAASVHRRPLMFHTPGDEHLSDQFSRMAKLLNEKKVSVGKLYKILCKYHSSCVEYKNRSERKSVFNFVQQELIPRFWGTGKLGWGG